VRCVVVLALRHWDEVQRATDWCCPTSVWRTL